MEKQSGWIIVYTVGNLRQKINKYWSGFGDWSDMPDKAIRFLREEDARKFSDTMFFSANGIETHPYIID